MIPGITPALFFGFAAVLSKQLRIPLMGERGVFKSWVILAIHSSRILSVCAQPVAGSDFRVQHVQAAIQVTEQARP